MKIDLRKVNKEIRQAFFSTNDVFVRSDSDGISDEWFELACESCPYFLGDNFKPSYTYFLADSSGRIGFKSASEAISFFLKKLSRPNFSGKIEVIS